MNTPSPIAYLDGKRLYRALVAGIQRVISRRDYINKINVFPVADGDTGTNMAFTLTAILEGMRALGRRTARVQVSEVIRAASESAIDGARGNSGAILAQFFQGLTEGVDDRGVLSAHDFALATQSGSDSARLAMSQPREGTILTVISDFAQEVGEQVRAGVQDFKVLLERGIQRARDSLAATTAQLEELRRANVVDAGAQGFVDLLEGIHEFIQSGSLRQLPDDLPTLDRMADADLPEMHEGDAEHRYCSECVVTGDGVTRQALMDMCRDLDHSSLVVAGHAGKARVHIHVDEPGDFFRRLESFGRIGQQKVDDMLAQQRAAHADAARVAIVTDTGGDLPASEVDRLNIHMVPVTVNFGGRSYLDKVVLSPQAFYEKLRTEPEPPRTSQPSPGEFRRPFEFLVSHHADVVSVNVSGNLSGTLQAAQTAAAAVNGERVHVVDSLNASAGQGLLALYAGEAAQAGLNGDQVIRVVETMRARTQTRAVIDDLSWGVRGGRLGRSKKIIADLLRITPIIGNSEEGRLVAQGVLFGRRSLVAPFARRMLKRMERHGLAENARWRLLIGHCDCEDRALELRDLLNASPVSIENLWITDAGTAIGAHAGPGSLVLGMQPFVPPRDLLTQLEKEAGDAVSDR